MKKGILIIVLPLVLAMGCKKESAPSTVEDTATVKYSWSTGTKGTYDIEYTGVNGTPVDTTYTGTSYVKTITVTRASGFKIANFKLNYHFPNNTDGGYDVDGEMTIYRNGYLETLFDVHLNQAFDNTGPFTCTTSIFGQ